MDVSVVIPLYNGAQWIEDTINSVLKQTHRPREIVVVDDGSEDNSQDIVRSKFPEVTLLQSPREGGNGAGPARSFGLRHTSAPLVAFLDQDDLWHPSHLRILTRLLRDNSSPAAIAGVDHFRGSSAPSYDLQPEDVEIFSPWEHFPLNKIHSPSSVVVRRSELERIGGWPSPFTISDVNAWYKLTTEAPMLRSSKESVGKRVHSGSYFQTLRTEKACSFLQDYVRACEDALDFRKTVKSEEEGFRDRLDAFKVIGEALEGVARDDTEPLRDTAQFLERECQVEQAMVKALWFFWLRLFSIPKSQIPTVDVSTQRLLLGGIINGWPNQCSRARKTLARALTQTMSYEALFSYGMHSPVSAVTSLLFFECMKMQMEMASKQVAEHVRARIDSTKYTLAGWMHHAGAAVDQLRPSSKP